MTNAEKVNEFLNQAGVWYFLTTDGDQPKGRPFRFHLLKDGIIYFGTGTFKNVFRQMTANPHVEILAMHGNEFLRYDGEAVLEESDIPPKVEYSLTEIGKAFQPVLDSIRAFGQEYISYMDAHSEPRRTSSAKP